MYICKKNSTVAYTQAIKYTKTFTSYKVSVPKYLEN